MATARRAITLEHLRMGALKGIVLDATGATVYNYYTEFGITQKTIDFALDVNTTEVISKVTELKRYMEQNLKGEVMTGIHVLCSSTFMDALVTHPLVKEAYARWQDGQALRSDMRMGFEFGGVTFEEYYGAADYAGSSQAFIADNEAHAFPLGTRFTFRTFFGPADFNETVNTIGIELYAKQEARRFDRGWDIHTQSNPLPICMQPALLVKLTV